MKTGRRFFLSGIAATLAGTRGPAGRRSRASAMDHPPQIPQIPDASNSAGRMTLRLLPASDPKLLLKEDQKTIEA